MPVSYTSTRGAANLHPLYIPGLSLWMSTRDNSKVLTSSAPTSPGAAADAWNSIIGGHTYTQGTAANQPVFTANSVGSWSMLDCDGTNDFFAGGTSTLSITQNISSAVIVAVLNWDTYESAVDSYAVSFATNGGGSRIAFGSGGDVTGAASRKMVARGLDADTASTLSTGGTFATGPEVLIGIFDFTNKRGRILRNGTQILAYTTFTNMTAGNTSNTTSANTTLGALGNGSANNSDVKIGDVLVYTNYIPSDPELTLLTRHFGSIYNISVA